MKTECDASIWLVHFNGHFLCEQVLASSLFYLSPLVSKETLWLSGTGYYGSDALLSNQHSKSTEGISNHPLIH